MNESRRKLAFVVMGDGTRRSLQCANALTFLFRPTMRDLFKPSTWFDQPRRLVAMLIGAAAFSLLVVSGLGPNWADAGSPADPPRMAAAAPLAVPPPPAEQSPAAAVAATAQIDQALATTQERYDARFQAIEARQLDVLTRIIESRSKTLDWWLAFLGTFTAVIGVLGALVPFLLTRTLRDQSAIDRQQIEATRADVRKMKEDAEKLVEAAQVDAQKIAGHQAEAAASVEKLKGYLPSRESGQGESSLPQDVADAARGLKDDPSTQMLDRLRAEAVLADENANVEKAMRLWDAVAELAPSDAQALFMSGYWHQELADRSIASNATLEARRLWAHAGERYQQALATKSDMHEAAYNWGNALSKEATAVAATDLTEARRLWAHASERYQQALAIKSDKHEAANNWGTALSAEATAVAATDLTEARRLWVQAGERYQQALAIKSDGHEAANNWGIALYREATAVAATDLTEARRLWAHAGERYQQALAIKSDGHEAANNWGTALSAEATAVAATDLTEARRVWALAGERYEGALAIKYNANKAAYNLACTKARLGLVAECMQWLETARLNNDLPSREHLELDVDLDGIRQSPEFVAWWNKHFNLPGSSSSAS